MPISQADREAGFTLLELLAVLAILALTASAVIYGGQRSGESARVRAFLINAEAMFRDARTAAIESQKETAVLIEADGRRLSFPAAERVLDVPKGVSLDAKVAAAAGGETPGVRFFPSGSSSGGELSFAFRGRSYQLRINWLTGRTHAETL
ncbi:MAG: GspH/FimT family pseudopilin [Aestuariivirga sp.]|jgi:general secretion pathway protein H|uniref:GspH/FimT family pseudopilin n=1 Tax=Aestuariivirga sp. TaxID=2650926 RepID=UPI0038D13F71